jgi:hypothetical protein
MGLISVITGTTLSLSLFLGIEGQSNAQRIAPSAIVGDVFACDLLPHQGLVAGWWVKSYSYGKALLCLMV